MLASPELKLNIMTYTLWIISSVFIFGNVKSGQSITSINKKSQKKKNNSEICQTQVLIIFLLFLTKMLTWTDADKIRFTNFP